MGDPSGTLALRPATPADYAAFVRLFPELRVDDPVADPVKFERDWMPTMLVATRDSATVGVAYYQVLQGVGFLRVLITAPAERRSGVGRALMTAVAERCRAGGCKEWCLNVFPDNVAAVRLYESFGMKRRYVSKALKMPWSVIDALPDQTTPYVSAARPIEPAEDARVEAEVKIVPGLLAETRAKGCTTWMIEVDGRVDAATVFDPAFPGAYPFRATDEAFALSMIRALRPHARPEHTLVHVVLEDQPAIADALRARGATFRLETMHMRGPLT